MIEGKRIKLRKLSEEDIPIVSKWLKSLDYSYFIEELPLDLSMYIKDLIEESRKEKGEAIIFVIVNKKNIPVGVVSLFMIDWENKNCRMNIFLPDNTRSFIYGAEAIFRCAMYAFNEMSMRKVYGHINEINKNSIKIFEKLGTKKEAVLRDYIRKDGRLQDTFIYGMFAQEFSQRRDTKSYELLE